MSSWSGLDFFIFLIFVLNTILGMSRGATKEIISMMCLSVALIFTIRFTIPIAVFLDKSPLIQSVLDAQMIKNFMNIIGAGPLTLDMLTELTYCVSVLICFVGVFSACEAMLTVVGFLEVFSFPYATLNRKVGAALGATRGYILTLLLILVLNHLFANNPITNSFFVNLFQSNVSLFDSLINSQNVEKYNELFKGKNLYNEQNILKALPTPK